LAFSACAAGAADFALMPVVGYGTPLERNAIADRDEQGVATADAGKGLVYGLSGAVGVARYVGTVSFRYSPTSTETAHAREVARVDEDSWRVDGRVAYKFETPPLTASLDISYGRFSVLSEAFPTSGWTATPTRVYDYGGDVYRAALLAGPRFGPVWGRVYCALIFGPAVSYVKRRGEETKRDPRFGTTTTPIDYGDTRVEFVYGGRTTLSLSRRYGLFAEFRLAEKLGEPRKDYPADPKRSYYITAGPSVNF
jgi:hypothetical protein